MKKLKRITAFAAAGVMAMQFTAFADFTDIPSGEMGEAILDAVENGLLNGYDDNTVRPDDNITRAQMAAIITRAFGAAEKADLDFSDVAEDAWYKEDVEKAVAMGAFEGDENGNFNPENNITFQETYTVLSRVFYFEPNVMTKRRIKADSEEDAKLKVEEMIASDSRIGKYDYKTYSSNGQLYADVEFWINTPSADSIDGFLDKDEVADWAADYTKAIVGNGGWTGIDGKLNPQKTITRGEFAILMDDLVGEYIDEAGEYDSFEPGLIMVRSGGVTLKNLNTDKNLIISYGVDSQCKVQDAEVNGVVAVLGGANPVESGDGTGLEAGNPYVSLSGDFYDVIIDEPYISVDCTNAKMKNCWVTEDSFVSIMTQMN